MVKKTVEDLENRFGPFRSDEGSNPSPSARDRKVAARDRVSAWVALAEWGYV